jgi:hypothetical protein
MKILLAGLLAGLFTLGAQGQINQPGGGGSVNNGGNGNGNVSITPDQFAVGRNDGTVVGLADMGVSCSGSPQVCTVAWQEDPSRGFFDPRRPRTEKIDGNNTVVTLASNSPLALQQTMNDASCWAQNHHQESTTFIPPGQWHTGSANQLTLTVGPGVHVLGVPGGTAGLGGGLGSSSPVGGTTFVGTYNNVYIFQAISPYTSACSDGTTVTDTMDGGDIENIQAYGCGQGGCSNAPGDSHSYVNAGPQQGGILVALGHATGKNLRAAYTGSIGVNASGQDSEFWDLHSYSGLMWYRTDRGQLSIPAPTTPSVSPSTTGGTLAAGTYFYKVTARTDVAGLTGETTAAPEVSATTTGTTSSVGLSWPAVTGASGYRVYRGTSAGAETGYLVTATNSLTDTGASLTTATVPTTNTSGTYFPSTDGLHGGVEWNTADGRYHNTETYGSFIVPGSQGTGASELGHVCGVVMGGGTNTADNVFEQIDEMGICHPTESGNARISHFRAEGNALHSFLNSDGALLADQGVISQGCTNQASVTANGFCDDLVDNSAGGGQYSNINIYDNPTLGTSFRTGFMTPTGAGVRCSNVNVCDGTGFDRTAAGAGTDEIGRNSWVTDQWKAILSADADRSPFEVLGTVVSGTSPNIAGNNYFYFTNGSPTSISGVTNPIVGQPIHVSLDHNTTLVSMANGGAWETCNGQNIVGPAGVLTFYVMDYGIHHRLKEQCDPLPASLVTNAADKSSTSTQAFAGPISAPQFGSVFYADGFPASCTVGGTGYTTQYDCALQTAFASAVANNSLATLYLGNHGYATNVPLVCTNIHQCVSIIGPGMGFGQQANDMTSITALTAMGVMISVPAAASGQLGNWTLRGFTLDGNNLAQAGIEANAVKVSRIEHIGLKNFTSTDHWIQVGVPTCSVNCNFQMSVNDVFLIGAGSAPANWGTATAVITGGVPVVTLVTGGSYVYANPAVYLNGNGAGTKFPCTTMGTITPIASGTGPFTLTGFTVAGFAGCSGTVYVVIPDLAPAAYGFASGTTDSEFERVVVQGVGRTAAINAGTANSAKWDAPHYYSGQPIGILDSGKDSFYDINMDSGGGYGFDCEGTCRVFGAKSFWNASYGGAEDFYVSPSANLTVMGHSCANAQSAGGYSQFVNVSGPMSVRNSANFFFNLGTFGAYDCDGSGHSDYSIPTGIYPQSINTTANGVNQLGNGTASDSLWQYATRVFTGWRNVDSNLLLQTNNSGGVGFYASNTLGSGLFAGFAPTSHLSYQAIGTAIASATTIAPTGSGIFHVTGTTPIVTITPPFGCTTTGFGCTVTLIPDGLWTTTNAGNIAIATTAVVSKQLVMTYDPAAVKWYPSY